LHCSIIGTCLSTAELRQIFVKLGRKEATTASEHDLHASGVLLAHQRQQGAKLLHKALDRRHRIWINQFGKAKTAEDVRAFLAAGSGARRDTRRLLGYPDAPGDNGAIAA
jgi:hypothetical protein